MDKSIIFYGMKLSETAKELVSNLSVEGDLPISRLAERIGCSEKTCRRTLQQLLDKGIVKRTVVINFYVLGYCQTNFMFNLHSQNAKHTAGLFEFICAADRVPWFCQNTGEYEYEFTYLSRSEFEFAEFLDALSGRFGGFIERRATLSELDFHLFGMKFLGRTSAPISLVRKEIHELDRVDHLILSALVQGYSSLQSVAEKLELPRSTVEYRVKKMESTGAIAGHILSLNRFALGYETTVLIIAGRGLGGRFKQDFFEYCRRHPNITLSIRTLGNADFKITVEGASGIADVVRASIEAQFRNEVASIEFVKRKNIFKSKTYPFNYEDNSVDLK